MFALWVGKLPTSRRYNRLPLLPSSPGGFARSWPYRTYPYIYCWIALFSDTKVHYFSNVTNISPQYFSKRQFVETFRKSALLMTELTNLPQNYIYRIGIRRKKILTLPIIININRKIEIKQITLFIN